MPVFYIIAGINHFVHPVPYLQIIPPYFPAHEVLNKVAGTAEICGGVFLFFQSTRSIAAYGIILLLLVFFTVHIYMIQQAPMHFGSLIISPFIAGARLPLQFLLIYWAYTYTNRFRHTNIFV